MLNVTGQVMSDLGTLEFEAAHPILLQAQVDH